MDTYSNEEKKALLKTARDAITARLIGSPEEARSKKIPPSLKEKRGCFVTLHKRGCLRGCIGTIEPLTPLIDGVAKNALNSAFCDPRFPALTTEELTEVHIEISVLTVPAPLKFTDSEDLKRKLKPGVHGLILSQGALSATFLPQVWNQLPGKEAFLDNLCLKAGLAPKAWKDKKTKIETYEVEYFSE